MALGVVMGTAALGSCAGALLAPRLASRYGPGPMMLGCLALTPLTQVPLLVAAPGLNWQLTIGAALVVQLFCAAAVGTTQRSIRQMIAEHHLQGRMQAVSTWLSPIRTLRTIPQSPAAPAPCARDGEARP